MKSPARSFEKTEVSPLELFFDLVFVFAVSQLSDHLLDHLTWRGAAETLVLLIAVFGVWAFTSFEATILHISQSHTQWMMLTVTVVGLFMNAALTHAFVNGAWAFVVPMILLLMGGAIVTMLSSHVQLLREHYGRMLVWLVASAPLWIVGALVGPESRLPWWAAAAAIDLVGMWLAHPVPGRVLHSENVEFDADHMIERCRLFLIIALGEAVLTAGIAIANAPRSLLTVVTGVCALVAIIALWALYFAGSDQLVNRNVETTSNPIFAARMAVSGLLVVVAGLIALAVGNELVITHPRGHGSGPVSLLVFGGPFLYLLSQTYYLWLVVGAPSPVRLATCAALVLAGGLALVLPPFVSLGLLTLILVILTVIVRPHRA